jgi:hypothetical protein
VVSLAPTPKVAQLQRCDLQCGAVAALLSASILGRLTTEGSTTVERLTPGSSPQVRLGKFFAIETAAKALADGFEEKSSSSSSECNQPTYTVQLHP